MSIRVEPLLGRDALGSCLIVVCVCVFVCLFRRQFCALVLFDDVVILATYLPLGTLRPSRSPVWW